MGFLSFFNRSPTNQTVRMVETQGSTFTTWNGKIFESDIVLSCIRPYVNAVGKLDPKHIVSGGGQEWPYIRRLLDNPNPYTTGQELQECIATSLKINNNAFVRVIRDSNGIPCELCYIPTVLAEAKYYGNSLYIRFTLRNGRVEEISYDNLLHIKNMCNDGEIFGKDNSKALCKLLDILYTADQSIVKAVRNGAVIRWLLKFTGTMRKEDIDKQVEEFASKFTNATNGTGVAGIDNKAEAVQVKPTDYVPNALVVEKITQRLYSLLGVNEKIIQNKYTEDEWNAYYEGEIEPVAKKLSNAYTNKLFTDGQMKFNNKIVFSSTSLQYASMSTKLDFVSMVDRGGMAVNEWRSIFNFPPVEGGDELIRRLDTAVVKKGGE